MKKAYWLMFVLLSAFFCFFNPAQMKINISTFTLINFLALAVCLLLFAFKQKQISEIKLSKAELFFALLLGLCITISCGLVHGDEFKVFYSSVGTGLFSCAEWGFYSAFSVYLFKFVFYKYNEFLCDENPCVYTNRKGFAGYVAKKIDNNKFGFYFLVLVVAWMVPFVINFPGLLMFDAKYQLYMYNHIPNQYTFASVLLDESQFITQHHSVPHTLLVGFIINLGKILFKSYDAGIFIYCVIQYLFMATVVSYMIKSVKPYFGTKYTVILTGFFALHPFFSISAILVTKDIYFCGFFVLYVLKYYEIIRNPEKFNDKKFFIHFLIITLLLILLRNNALFTLIIVSCGMFLFMKKKKNVSVYVCIILAFNLVYTNILLPAFDISKGSIREMLSIPFQQTARYIKEYPDEITTEENRNIRSVLECRGIINRYNPDLSDPVKNGYNKYATGEDLKNYFITWGKMFVKHPVTYIEAFIHLNYGYYCPGAKDCVTYDCLNDFDVRSSMKLMGAMDINAEKPGIISMGYYYFQCFVYLCPIINLVMDSGAYIWLWILIIFALLRNKKDKKYIMYYLPYFAYLLFILAGPANGTIYSRYVMPFIYTLPLMFLPFFECKYNDEKTKMFRE